MCRAAIACSILSHLRQPEVRVSARLRSRCQDGIHLQPRSSRRHNDSTCTDVSQRSSLFERTDLLVIPGQPDCGTSPPAQLPQDAIPLGKALIESYRTKSTDLIPLGWLAISRRTNEGRHEWMYPSHVCQYSVVASQLMMNVSWRTRACRLSVSGEHSIE